MSTIDFKDLKPYLANYLQDEFNITNLRKNFSCPICGAGHNTPCMSYNNRDNTVKCFSCGWHGDIINLVADLEHITPREAAERIAQRYNGVEIKHDKPTAPPDQKEQTLQDFTEYAQNCAHSSKALTFFTSRGLSAEIVQRFGLGYDESKNEAIIPYTDPQGVVRWYTGRRNYKAEFKYNNPANSSRPFPYNAAELLADTDKPIFVCEGEINTLSALELKFPACGIGSTSNYRLFLSFVERYKPKRPLILILDNDEVGQRTQNNMSKALSELHIEHLSITFPVMDKDLNDILQANREQLKAILTDIYTTYKERVRTTNTAKTEKNDFINASSCLDDFWSTIQSDSYKPLSTGYDRFNKALGGGIIPKSVVFVGAQPSVGKTTFIQGVTENMVAVTKRPLLVFNFEQSWQVLTAKTISRISYESSEGKAGIISTDILQGYAWESKLDGAQQAQLRTCKEKYAEIAPYINYANNCPARVSDILDRMERFAEAHPNEQPIVVIDYLQMLTGEKGEDLETICSHLISGCRSWIGKHNGLVFIVTAFNRASGGDVSLSSGRGTSNIEYSADYYIGLSFSERRRADGSLYDDKELKEQPVRKIRATILKNKLGSTGHTDFTFYAKYNYFTEKEDEVLLAEQVRQIGERKRGADIK